MIPKCAETCLDPDLRRGDAEIGQTAYTKYSVIPSILAEPSSAWTAGIQTREQWAEHRKRFLWLDQVVVRAS